MAPTTWGTADAWSIQLQTEPYAHLTVVDAGDAPIVPTRFERSLRVIHEKVFRVAEAGPIPIVLGRRSFDHLSQRGRGGAARVAADGRDASISTRTPIPAPINGATCTPTASRCAV